MSLASTVKDRFWSRVDLNGPTIRAELGPCWIWTGGTDREGGYGTLHTGDKVRRSSVKAHRFSWELHHSSIPQGLWVLHRCDNPPCVNPAHLFLGTRQDNMLDAAQKGRICTVGHSRVTHCKQGHEFTESNTIRRSNGQRDCRVCVNASKRKYRASLKAKTAAIRRDPAAEGEGNDAK